MAANGGKCLSQWGLANSGGVGMVVDSGQVAPEENFGGLGKSQNCSAENNK
jgi:hypothetical protein